VWSWVNGTLAPLNEGRIALTDHGFTVGDGVFETLKIERGVPYALSRHLRRLRISAKGLALPEPDEDLVRAAVAEVCARQPYDLGVLRITYTSGPGPLGSMRGDEGCTLAVVSMPGKAWPPSTKIHVSRWPRNERSPLTGLKTTSYAENVVALAAAHAVGASEAVMANLAGNLCEGTGSNVFVVLDGAVVTPPLTDGCLAGVTRGLVLDWFDVEERTLPLQVLHGADEVFLTSCTRDVHPVHAVDDRPLTPGPVTLAIKEQFSQRCQADPDPR
jgi:branched-chain amino acid aminotransferase